MIMDPTSLVVFNVAGLALLVLFAIVVSLDY